MEFLDLVADLGLNQFITVPTHIKGNTLDLLFFPHVMNSAIQFTTIDFLIITPFFFKSNNLIFGSPLLVLSLKAHLDLTYCRSILTLCTICSPATLLRILISFLLGMGLLKMRYLYQLLQNGHVESMLTSTFHLIQCISLIKAGQTTEKCHVIPSTLPCKQAKVFVPGDK